MSEFVQHAHKSPTKTYTWADFSMPGLLRLPRRKPCCKKSPCRHTSGGAMACLAGQMAAEPAWETCCISLRSHWTRCISLFPPHCCCCQWMLPACCSTLLLQLGQLSPVMLMVGAVITAARLANYCQKLLAVGAVIAAANLASCCCQSLLPIRPAANALLLPTCLVVAASWAICCC